jgi:hypothetical protein
MTARVLAIVAGLVTCGLVTVSALADGGGTSIATAPNLPIGQQVSGGGTAAARGHDFADYWRVTFRRADQFRLDYGSTNGNNVGVCLYDPSVTDYTLSNANCFDVDETNGKHEFRYTAPSPGRYTLQVWNYGGGTDLAYAMTGYIQHYTHATLTGPSIARAHTRIALAGKIAGLSSGKVAIQTNTSGRWKTQALLPVRSDGSFRLTTRVGAAGTFRARVVFYGDADDLPTSAGLSLRVV